MNNKCINARISIIDRIRILIMVLCLCLSACSDDKGKWQSPHPLSADEQWVAHAGGSLPEKGYTNSLEALNNSYRAGMHLVELDFEWTKDGTLVLLHDWKDVVSDLYGQGPGQRTLAQFKALKTSRLTPLSAQDLFAWLDAHPNVVIITDVKSDSVKALEWIQANYPSYAERFIPQIYHFEEYEPVRRLGYYRVILTLYRLHKEDADALSFCRTHPVWAVTMPEKRVFKGSLTEDLRVLHIPVYVHTVNEPERMDILFRRGVFGIYTDRTDINAIKKSLATFTSQAG